MLSKIFLDECKIERYKHEFAETGCVFLPGFLEKNTLQNLLNKIEKSTFQTKWEGKEDNKFGKVLALPRESVTVFLFTAVLNNPGVFKMMQYIADCGRIGNFVGRIHRSEAGEDHEIGWHSDASDNRLLAVTLSLGTDRYSGAKLQIRETGSENITKEFGQLEAGDAVIFKIDRKLEHRLSILESGRRTVGVGWFRSPDL